MVLSVDCGNIQLHSLTTIVRQQKNTITFLYKIYLKNVIFHSIFITQTNDNNIINNIINKNLQQQKIKTT